MKKLSSKIIYNEHNIVCKHILCEIVIKLIHKKHTFVTLFCNLNDIKII